MDKIDLTKNNEEQEEQSVMLSFEEIINAASGMSRDGHPATMGRLVISYMIDKDTVKNESEASFGDAVIDFFASGGCMVVQADFPQRSTQDFNRIAEICSTYMANVGNEAWHENRELMAVMVPLAFYGDITIVLQDLVYFTAINLENNATRLIMCFNNMMTQLMENEDIDYNEIVLSVRNEDRREEEDIRNQLALAEEELKRLEEMDNDVARSIQQNFSHENLLNKDFRVEKQEPINSGFRFTNDEDE